MTDLNRIELYCVDGGLNLASMDPNSLIVQTYLKFAQVEFETKPSPYTVPCLLLPGQVGEAQLPMMKHIVGSRSHTATGVHAILTYLKEKSVDLDAYIQMKDSDLDSMSTTTLKEIRAEVIAYTSLIEEKLYPCLVHHLWLNDQNYAVTKQEFFKNTPFLMRWFYSPLLRRQYADYVRRMESKERKVAEDRAKECLSALSVLLGNKPYFYGETPSTLDAVVHGYLSCFKFTKLPDPTLANLVAQFANLEKHTTNISKLSQTQSTRKLSTKVEPPKAPAQNDTSKHEKKTMRRFWILAGGVVFSMLLYTFGTTYSIMLRKKRELQASQEPAETYHYDDQFDGLVDDE